MKTKIIEVTNNNLNWGKFLVGKFDSEWSRLPLMDPKSRLSLLTHCGWESDAVHVLDLQTGEGAIFTPIGLARADLDKHRIWVCPMFEPFLTWLYQQDLSDITKLPDELDLKDAEFAFQGYRRTGPKSESTT